MAQYIRKQENHFIRTGELSVYFQEKYIKIKNLLDDKDFIESCQM